jgi:hypothetical protein
MLPQPAFPNASFVRGFAKKKKGKGKKSKTVVSDTDDVVDEMVEEEDAELVMEEFDAAKVTQHMTESCTKAIESFKIHLKGVRSGRPDASKYTFIKFSCLSTNAICFQKCLTTL